VTELEKEELDEMRRIFAPVFLKAGVRKAILFGAYARGSQSRKSDVDILVVMDTEKRFFERFDIFSELYDLFKGRALDLLIYTPGELEEIAHRGFVRKICDEGKVLYES
jgi:predicted nucleotidyltransferase